MSKYRLPKGCSKAKCSKCVFEPTKKKAQCTLPCYMKRDPRPRCDDMMTPESAMVAHKVSIGRSTKYDRAIF